jgi:hypothetical protein
LGWGVFSWDMRFLWELMGGLWELMGAFWDLEIFGDGWLIVEN